MSNPPPARVGGLSTFWNFSACRYCIRVDNGVPFLSAVGEGLTLTEGNNMSNDSGWVDMTEHDLTWALYADAFGHDCFKHDDGVGFCNECGAMLVRAQ